MEQDMERESGMQLQMLKEGRRKNKFALIAKGLLQKEFQWASGNAKNAAKSSLEGLIIFNKK